MSEAYGILGVFETPEGVKAAAAQLRALGFGAIAAYTPYPVEGLGELIDPGRKRFPPLFMFAGALLGGAWGYFIQYWDEAWDYPINVGGRPHDSWPAFIVGAFEFMLLVTVAFGLFAMLAASRLPQLYHPLFNAEAFARVSRDRFALCVEASDPGFDASTIRRVFERHGAESVSQVTA